MMASHNNCRSCGRLFPMDKFKSGYCPRCLRAKLAEVNALYDEAIRLKGQMLALEEDDDRREEYQAFFRVVIGKIITAESEAGVRLLADEDMARLRSQTQLVWEVV